MEGQIEPQLLPGTLGELPLLRMLSIAMLVGKASKLEKDIKWCLVVRLHHEATLVSSKMKEHVDAIAPQGLSPKKQSWKLGKKKRQH